MWETCIGDFTLLSKKFIYLFEMWIYKRERERETEKLRAHIQCSHLKCLQWPGEGQEPGTRSRSPVWVAGTSVPVASQRAPAGKLGWGAGPRLGPGVLTWDTGVPQVSSLLRRAAAPGLPFSSHESRVSSAFPELCSPHHSQFKHVCITQ